MDELQELIVEQQQDKRSFKVKARVENETLIRPYLYRFPNFVGDTPRQKTYSLLKHLGWVIEDIHSAMNIDLEEVMRGDFDYGATSKPENYQKFFVEIPKKTPRHKAILILRGLGWTVEDTAEALKVCVRTVKYVTACLR